MTTKQRAKITQKKKKKTEKTFWLRDFFSEDIHGDAKSDQRISTTVVLGFAGIATIIALCVFLLHPYDAWVSVGLPLGVLLLVFSEYVYIGFTDTEKDLDTALAIGYKVLGLLFLLPALGIVGIAIGLVLCVSYLVWVLFSEYLFEFINVVLVLGGVVAFFWMNVAIAKGRMRRRQHKQRKKVLKKTMQKNKKIK